MRAGSSGDPGRRDLPSSNPWGGKGERREKMGRNPNGALARPIFPLKKDLDRGGVSRDFSSCPAPLPPSSLKAQASSRSSSATNSRETAGSSL